jgi:hypothetical protein
MPGFRKQFKQPPEYPASVGADDDLSAAEATLLVVTFTVRRTEYGVYGVRTDFFATDGV